MIHGSGSVFAKMSFKIGQNKIKAAFQKQYQQGIPPAECPTWLLRESSKPGCLTMDYVKTFIIKKDQCTVITDSRRFVLLKPLKLKEDVSPYWVAINEEQYEPLRKSGRIIFMTMDNYQDEERLELSNKLFNAIKSSGFQDQNMLEPNIPEATRNNAYSAISKLSYITDQAEQADDFLRLHELADRLDAIKIAHDKDHDICSITLEELKDCDEVTITPSGHKFESTAISTWTTLKSTNPLTREKLKDKDLLVTEAPKKEKDALEKAEKALKASEASMREKSSTPRSKKNKLS